LETLRLVSNFETENSKLIQIIIAGQPQLARKLASAGQEQLRQRLSTIARIEALSLQETISYVNHRLKRAGYTGQNLFTPDALETIWEQSDGIPRRINTLCFNAIMLAFADERKDIDRGVVEEILGDLSLELLEPELWQFLQRALSQARFTEQTYEGIGSELSMTPGSVDFLMHLMTNDAGLLGVIRYIAGCDAICSFAGRVYRLMPGEGHGTNWHNDLDGPRLVAMSVNLSPEIYGGGTLQLRNAHTRRVLREVANTRPGDALLF